MSSIMNSSQLYFDEEWFLNEVVSDIYDGYTSSRLDAFEYVYNRYFPTLEQADAIRDKYYPNHYERICIGYRPDRMDLFEILYNKLCAKYIEWFEMNCIGH